MIGQHLEEANQYYADGKWKKAFKQYSKHVQDYPGDSLAWYRLGQCAVNFQDYREALTHYSMALKQGFSPAQVFFSESQAYAWLGQDEQIYASLDSAIAQGFSNFKLLASDSAFADHQRRDAFLTRVNKARMKAYPCLSDSVRRHFDFWLGEWDVYVHGRKVGENNITLANGGCAIHESYTTPGSYTGQSINYFDRMDGKWHQTWVGSEGGVLDYVETGREAGMLQFEANYLSASGELLKSRLTFTANEDGTVRQYFENSKDSGKSWTPGFDGLYKKKEQ